jgi:hypothetical protein
MIRKLFVLGSLSLASLLPAQQACAHISYKNIQAGSQSTNANGSTSFNVLGLLSGNGAWANATDANWGNTHSIPWYKFEISNPSGATVNLTVSRAAISDENRTAVFNQALGPDPFRVDSEIQVLNDLTPAFSLYKGLLPNHTHDGATELPGKDGVWQALADTTGGNGPGDVYDYHLVDVYNDQGEVIGQEPTGEPTFLYNDPGEVATIQYLMHAGEVDGSAPSVSLANVFLSPGIYTVALGGACYECYPHYDRFDPASPTYDPSYENQIIDIETDNSIFRGYSLDLTVTAVPVPGAIWLMGSGLLGLLRLSMRQTRKAVNS